MRLLPRQEKFFEYFLTQANIITKASLLLLEGVRAGNGKLSASVPEIEKLEQQGDEIIHEVFTKLNQTFITPIDPEDIHVLASDLDDVLDCIEDAAHRITAYRLDPIPPTVVGLSEIIQACAKTLTKAFEALEKNGHVLDHCIEINRLEESADQLYRRAVADLFLNETNPIYLMKVKEVYEILEDTADRCEDVADALQNVVVKNS
jgi:predicted phosphate transport protein (TIGR00153 family)